MNKLHPCLLIILYCNLTQTNDETMFMPAQMDNQSQASAKKATLKSYLKMISAVLGIAQIGSIFSGIISQQIKLAENALRTNGKDDGALVICTFKILSKAFLHL